MNSDLQSYSKLYFGASTNHGNIENRNQNSFQSSESNLSGVASIWSAKGVESPTSLFLSKARQEPMSSQERRAPQRSRSFEDTTISMPKLANRWIEESSRSDGAWDTTDTTHLCPTRLLKRHDLNNTLGGPRDGGNSFFLNMMTASNSQDGNLISASIDLSKPIGLSDMRRRSQSNEDVRLINRSKKIELGFLVPSPSPNSTNLAHSGFNLERVTASNDPSQHSILLQQDLVNDTILDTIHVACPSSPNDTSALGDSDLARVGEMSVTSLAQVSLQKSCSSTRASSSLGGSKYSIDTQVNRKWRQCLSRSRSLRLVSLRN